ncbi:unnamed protein product [Rotaria magnacalcarata]|uniref:Uncharacterized protein n=1 Tax=Rotaria magnacalcarata TaxID=392030 RepID=A0A8S3CV16_9BILA|nr:unnamed protein product [Rotaria magnacalcarata]CAF4922446.1 unnamed protein product [Rotaria magnacalcarata]
MKSNLRKNLSIDQQTSGGFLSIDFSYDVLRKIRQLAPSIRAKDSNSNKLVGYALTSLPEFAAELPNTAKLVTIINTLEYKSKPVRD